MGVEQSLVGGGAARRKRRDGSGLLLQEKVLTPAALGNQAPQILSADHAAGLLIAIRPGPMGFETDPAGVAILLERTNLLRPRDRARSQFEPGGFVVFD